MITTCPTENRAGSDVKDGLVAEELCSNQGKKARGGKKG